MADDHYDQFLTASPGQRRLLLDDAAVAAAVGRRLGDAALQELRSLPRPPLGGHLGDDDDGTSNVVFVPGVMGSLLHNTGKTGVWWIDVRNAKHLDHLGLTPNGLKDADRGSRLLPFNVDQTYEPFFVNAAAEPGFSVEMFPYDWRRSIWTAGDAFTERLVALHDEGGRQVHVVAHSMGGLVVRAALASHGEKLWPIVDKVVFLGTPHFGATAIASYLKNHFWGFEALAVLGCFLSRETFRSLWGPLFMLPAPVGVYPGTRDGATPSDHPCANFDLYSATAWDLGLTPTEQGRLGTILDAAADFHRRIWTAHQALEQDQLDRMLMIAGVGSKTLYRIETGRLLGTKRVTREQRRDPNRVGDSRVPLASAKLDWLDNLRYTRGKHGALPNVASVHADVFRFLRGQPLTLPTTIEGAFAGHLGGEDGASVTPSLDGSTRDDWEIEALDEPQRLALMARVERGDYPALELARLM